MFAFAEVGRGIVVEKTQESKAIARKHPKYHIGRPKKYKKKQLEHALEQLEDHTYSQVIELTGISKATIARVKIVMHAERK